jgi:hypothetical protein
MLHIHRDGWIRGKRGIIPQGHCSMIQNKPFPSVEMNALEGICVRIDNT